MKILLCKITVFMYIICNVCAVYAFDIEPGGLVAFPGAEGGGMYTTGARESMFPTIYHVTTLDDSGNGSLRDGLSSGNRIIVFDVAGTINLTKSLNISKPNITILGQTSPGDGICISGAPTIVKADNIIIRYLRFRMGIYDYENCLYDSDSFGATSNTSNLIVDHCSMSWSSDECCSVYAVKDSTIQWCIITEPINIGIHWEEGELQAHGYGGIWGGKNMSYHHNLVSSCVSRYPLAGTSATVRSYNDEPDYLSLLDIRNNIFYNWQSNTSYGGQNMVRINLVSNYYQMGPASNDIKRFYKMYGTRPDNNCGYPIIGAATDLAIDGNYYSPLVMSDKVEKINNNNLLGVDFDSHTKSYNLEKYDESIPPSERSHTQYIKNYPIITQTALDAYSLVLNQAGANIVRDSVDERAVSNARKGIATVGVNGIINYNDYILMDKPQYNGVKKCDTDNDGIPDDWEDMNGLDKTNPLDALYVVQENQHDGKYTGYYNIEAYSFDILENPLPPEPTNTPLPTASPKHGIYYVKSPVVDGNIVSATIVNTIDDNGAMFIVCTYDDTHEIMTDVKIEKIGKSDLEKEVEITMNNDKNIKTFLWSSSFGIFD